VTALPSPGRGPSLHEVLPGDAQTVTEGADDEGLEASVVDPRDPTETDLASYMAEAGRILGASLDTSATLRQVAELIVPRIADWCAIDLLEEDGRLSTLVISHRDPERIAMVEELRDRYPPDPDASVGSYAVARSGQGMIIATIDESLLSQTVTDEDQMSLLRRLGLRSWMCAPMIGGGRVSGTIAFAAAESGRRFGPRHLAFAVDLAARAGAALENARAFHVADRFRRILDAVAEAVFVVEPSTGRILEVNEGALELLGIGADALLGRRFWDLLEATDADAIERLVRPVRESRVESRTAAVRIRREDDSSVPVEILLQRMELVGEAPTLVAIARDIRERIESQGRLERLARAEHARAAELNAVIRAMGDGVIVCGPDGRILLANPAAREMFADRSINAYADVLAVLHDQEGIAPPLGVHGGPIVLRTRGEPERWIEAATYPVADRSSQGEPRGETILVLRDVTEQRQREAVRETFIGVLSHELKTPITTIFGGARILSREDSGLDEATRREIFGDVADEAERLKRLVEDVVALSRFGESDADVGREPVLLQRVVPGVVASEEDRWPDVHFQTTVQPGLPPVMADPTYLEQIVRNFLSNGAKYGGSGAEIKVFVQLDEDSDEVVVRVVDDGPGIAADEADRLFDLFYRSPLTASSTAGAGIGLFVCARLMRAMGGRIWAKPLTAGAEFGFALRVMHED
jgi:two-component system sensor histidine kinase BarA